jgi:hypothetical protein
LSALNTPRTKQICATVDKSQLRGVQRIDKAVLSVVAYEFAYFDLDIVERTQVKLGLNLNQDCCSLRAFTYTLLELTNRKIYIQRYL